jgi:hypothetical protein
MSLPSAEYILVPPWTGEDMRVTTLLPMIVAFLAYVSKRLPSEHTGGTRWARSLWKRMAYRGPGWPKEPALQHDIPADLDPLSLTRFAQAGRPSRELRVSYWLVQRLGGVRRNGGLPEQGLDALHLFVAGARLDFEIPRARVSTLGRIVGDHPDGELLDAEGLFQKGRELSSLTRSSGVGAVLRTKDSLSPGASNSILAHAAARAILCSLPWARPPLWLS